ncbi:hypothetical protein GO730_35300 [Spirosoma sp. HMF3257]|uniref:Glycosyltransferase family 9 protein n=1 Tax=Spirosoma telluris TaxID=2183553 RepID=A0A327NUC7_9BACT|nr:hypothetical protein [Spirosoma telluris]RAI78039.1 hypothetical protein HMF3257_35205 [Spirosoma telluris]
MGKEVHTKPWQLNRPPKRILAIRFQAVGDVLGIYPYLQAVKNKYPEVQIDLLTKQEKTDVAKHIGVFRHVWAYTDSTKRFPEILHALWFIIKLLPKRYELILDFQNHTISQWIRKLLFPKAFSEFDRFGDEMGSVRYFQTVERSGLLDEYDQPDLQLNDSGEASKLLHDNGWDGQSKLVILNPAGAFPSRHWPWENYVAFARLWLRSHPDSQFLILGTGKINVVSQRFKELLGDRLLNLTGKTTLLEALLITKKSCLLISEDSGLLHIGWLLKINTIALIGSTHKNRSAQVGENMHILNSDDLPCGNCMKINCEFGPVPLCLSRYSPDFIVSIAEQLVANK